MIFNRLDLTTDQSNILIDLLQNKIEKINEEFPNLIGVKAVWADQERENLNALRKLISDNRNKKNGWK